MNPPQDLIEFIQAAKQLQYDAAASQIGLVRLKSSEELEPSRLQIPTGCQDIDDVDDPYEPIDGYYEAEVLDLVAHSEKYNPEGLLCWIAALNTFGSVDTEHGTVRTFPGATWSDIAASPRDFLDSQWEYERDVSQVELPWLHFPFRLAHAELEFLPYGQTCPLHKASLKSRAVSRPPLFQVIRRRELSDWIEKVLAEFPCSGVPINSVKLLYCPDCSNTELRWYESVLDSIASVETHANDAGWAQCPYCGLRFSLLSKLHFQDNTHLTCGQKLRVILPGS